MLFQLLHTGDADMVGLWRRFRDLSLDEYTKMYQVWRKHNSLTSTE